MNPNGLEGLIYKQDFLAFILRTTSSCFQKQKNQIFLFFEGVLVFCLELGQETEENLSKVLMQ
jgi:hypothetical protein